MPDYPTPPQLFDEFEAGRLTRPQLHTALAWHAQRLFEEIEEVRADPKAAWWEAMLARRYANRLAYQHGERRLRRILTALSRAPGFELARYLWNADHPDVPLHCFFRLRRPPCFRILSILHRRGFLLVTIAIGPNPRHPTIREFWMQHDLDGFIASESPPI